MTLVPPTAIWGRPVVAVVPIIIESSKGEVITTGGTIAFTFTAANAGDLLMMFLINVSSSSLSGPSGWSGLGSVQTTMPILAGTQWALYKVATGGETSANVSLSSGTGMKSAIFINVRGTDGTIYGFATTGSGAGTSGTTVTAPTLTSVPAGTKSFSVFSGCDDFLDNAAQFNCAVSGTGWTELQDACSNIPSQDQGAIDLAYNDGTGTLAAGAATFSRTNKARSAMAFYLKH